MNIDTLHIGMKVRHPEYGVGVVKSLTEQIAEIAFDDAPRTIAPAPSDLQPAEATATLSELEMPLANLIHDTAHAVVEALGLEQKDVLVEGLATRWQRGTLVMQPADSSLQPKEVPLETFFHKIVMIRNNLRVLEQKVNASDPPSPRLGRAKQTERCGQVRPATVYHALLRITEHVQHPVQKQGRPVPNRRPGQRRGQAACLNELERTNQHGLKRERPGR